MSQKWRPFGNLCRSASCRPSSVLLFHSFQPERARRCRHSCALEKRHRGRSVCRSSLIENRKLRPHCYTTPMNAWLLRTRGAVFLLHNTGACRACLPRYLFLADTKPPSCVSLVCFRPWNGAVKGIILEVSSRMQGPGGFADVFASALWLLVPCMQRQTAAAHACIVQFDFMMYCSTALTTVCFPNCRMRIPSPHSFRSLKWS